MVSRVMTRLVAVFLAVVVGQAQQPQAPPVNVTGAWDLTIVRPGGSVTGLAVLSQDGAKVVGMLGPLLTDMFPVEGTWEGSTLTIVARPRSGRSTAFATFDVTGTRERLSGTIDTDKGTIELVRRKREG